MDLFDAPERATLDALCAVLHAATAALLVANPELLEGDLQDQGGTHPAQAWIAERILAEARTLRHLLERYDAALEVLSTPDCRHQDLEIPF